MSFMSSLKNTLQSCLPLLKNSLLLPALKEKSKALVLKLLDDLLKKALNSSLKLGSTVSPFSQQPVMAALQLVSLATQAEATESLPDKLTVAARVLYSHLPELWKSPDGPLAESELLALLRDGLRLSRSIQSVISKNG